uniref:BESS domain-containing protein n=1 Tax=Anopheles merus TaxID=30066 RepID=A0A182VB87_ANOME
MNQPSGSGYNYMGWKYFNQMSFLKEVQESRPRMGNLPTCEDTFEAEYLEDDDVQVDTDHTDRDGLVSTNNDVGIAPTRKRSKEKPADNALEALLELERKKQQLLGDIETRKSEKNQSTNYYYLNSLVGPLNSLPLVAQLNIKKQLSAILHAALRENAQNTKNQM